MEQPTECSHYWEIKQREDYRSKKKCKECGEPQPTVNEYAVCRLCGELGEVPRKTRASGASPS